MTTSSKARPIVTFTIFAPVIVTAEVDQDDDGAWRIAAVHAMKARSLSCREIESLVDDDDWATFDAQCEHESARQGKP